jgi:NitT/TauT family transport system substrate-binding protein
MKRSLVAVLALMVAACGRTMHSGDASVQVAIGGRAALDFIPMYLASSLGYFREEGVQVTLQDLSGTPKAMQALLGGSAELAVGGYEAAVQMNAEGKQVRAITVMERWPPLVVVISPKAPARIREIRDLKGATVGVSTPGSGTHRFMNYLLVRHGVSPTEISTVGVGVNFSVAAALQQGHVDAAVTGPLGAALATATGNVRIVGDCRTADGARRTLGTDNMPFAVLMARAEWTWTHQDTCRRLGRAMRRTLAWIGNHTAADVVNAMPAEYRGQDHALYLRAVTEILPAFSRDGLMPADGPVNMRNYLSVSDERIRTMTLDLTTTFTNEFVVD